MTKRTPLEKRQASDKKAQARKRADIEADLADSENMLRTMSDATLSLKQRIQAFKRLDAWPRIVLGLYQAELAAAQSDRKETGDTDHNDEPSDIAYENVGKAIGLQADRVKDLCKRGREHLRQGFPPNKTRTIADFKRDLSTTVSESDAAAFRQQFVERKKWALSHFE